MRVAPLGLVLILGLAVACAACAPAAAPSDDPAAAGSTRAVASTADASQATADIATAYPPPMQTAKAAAATEAAAFLQARETAAAVGRDEPVTATDMVGYANPDLGLAFAYPRVLGEVAFERRPGETGEAWLLRFSRYDAMKLAGISPDFSEGRGGMFEDTYGYARREDGSVCWLSNSCSEIAIEEVVASDSGGHEAVVFLLPELMGTGEGAPPGPLAALVNLEGGHFPGLIVLNRDPERLPFDTVRAILRTFEVSAPTEGEG